MLSDDDINSLYATLRTKQLAEVLARKPTSYVELKAIIESILERTAWPVQSEAAAQLLLEVVRQIPDRKLNCSDPPKANRAVQDVWEKVKDASLTYNMQKRGPFRQMKSLLGGGVKSCTIILTSCQEELISAIPRAGPLDPALHDSTVSRSRVIPPVGHYLPPPYSYRDPGSTLVAGSPASGTDVVQQRLSPSAEGSGASISQSIASSASVADTENQLTSPRAESSPVTVDTSTAASASVADVGTQIISISPIPVKVNGHFCDVFVGIHSGVGKVALKRPRIGDADSNDIIRRCRREAETWGKLQHPHILEFLGTFQRDGHFYFVSPFIENGTLAEYIVLHPGVNRIKHLCETADAIHYLHMEGVVHGDIKANNLLIGYNEQVLLCDFGLTRTTDLRTSTAMKGAGTLRWQSPELWDDGSRSFKSDVYAFGMTIAEVLTGDVPFPDLQTDGAVVRAVLIENKRPPKNPAVSSAGLSYENVWAVAEACWPAVPEERLSMIEALQRIQEDPAIAAM